MSARLKVVLFDALMQRDKRNDEEGPLDIEDEIDHIAAAVVAWAQSDPVLKKAGSAFWSARGTWQERARAALAAAVGGDGTEGR